MSLDDGMFAQGNGFVVSPTSEHAGREGDAQTLKNQGEGFEKLSDLVKAIRQIN
ncbi:hypothetical protein [Actinomadura sp. 9N407]|uniref:hypothetical protein n=1 Tax=Actinomadura sp. 9N407 TaxID=3375154 RepID=UPI0037B8775D